MVLLPSITVPGFSITKLKNVTFLMYTKLKMYFFKNANTNMIGYYNVYMLFYTKKIIKFRKAKIHQG